MTYVNPQQVPGIGYYLGLDPAYLQDRTALVVVSEPVFVSAEEMQPPGWAYHANMPASGWVLPKHLTPWQFMKAAQENNAHTGARPPYPPLMIEDVTVLPPKTKRKDVVSGVAQVTKRYARIAPTVLVVDRSGSGMSYLEDLMEAGEHPVGILATGGEQSASDPHGFRVPRLKLMETAKGYIERERVKVLSSMKEGGELIEELRNFDPRTTTSGGADGWRSKASDDRVSGLALALWYRHLMCWRRDVGHAGVIEGPRRRHTAAQQGVISTWSPTKSDIVHLHTIWR